MSMVIITASIPTAAFATERTKKCTCYVLSRVRISDSQPTAASEITAKKSYNCYVPCLFVRVMSMIYQGNTTTGLYNKYFISRF